MKLPFQLDRYTLTEAIGSGAFGRVYLAEVRGDLGFVSEFAVKVLNSGVVADNPNVARQMADEARILAQLDHPNIVKVIDFKHEDHEVLGDIYYMVLEYVRGRDVADILDEMALADREMPATAVLRMGIMVADALAHAHDLIGRDGRSLGLVHRDLKPQNLMVNFRGQVKVLDFGIAKARDHRLAARTQEGQTKGTVFYMSPEQLTGDELDARADLYSLGAILYEMLLGRRLLDVDVATPADLARAMHEAFELDIELRLTELREHLESGANGELPRAAVDGWIALLRHTLQKDPRYRPKSARVFSEQLEWLRSQHPTPLAKNFWANVVDEASGSHNRRSIEGPPEQVPDDGRAVGPTAQEFFGMESGAGLADDVQTPMEIAAAAVPQTRAMSVVSGTVRAFGSTEIRRLGPIPEAQPDEPPPEEATIPYDVSSSTLETKARGPSEEDSLIRPEDLEEDETIRPAVLPGRSGGPDRRLVGLVLGTLVVLLSVLAIVLVLRGRSEAPAPTRLAGEVTPTPTATPTLAAAATPAPTPVKVEPAAVEASEPIPQPTATPAGSRPTPRPRSTPRPEPTPRAVATPTPAPAPTPAAAVAAVAPGKIHISARPRCSVTIDGKPYGTTDETRKGVELSPGTYVVRFKCDDEQECAGFEKTTGKRTVTVKSGESANFTADFYRQNNKRRQ